MNCVECQAVLFEYVEGLVTENQTIAIETHVAGCETCRNEENAIRTLQDRLVSQGQSFDEDTLETDILGAIVREQKTRFAQGVQQASLAVKIRRQLMNHPISKIAVAAIVIAACVLGGVFMTSTSSVALADVLTKIETVAVYMFQTTATMTGDPVENYPFDLGNPSTVLVSKDLGYAEKTILSLRDPNSQDSVMEMYFLPEQKKAMTINHKDKQYIEMDFDANMFERMKGQRDARAIVRNALKCEYESLGHEIVGGIECEGFLVTDPTYQGGMFGEVKVELWVDVDTYLPVRLETETQISDNQRLHTVSNNFQWDIEVDAREFDPVIPEGYTTPLSGPVQVPAMNEESLVKGLQLLIDMGSPSHPEELTMGAMTSKLQYFQEQMMQLMQADDREAAKAFMLEHYGIDLDQGKPTQEQLMQGTMRITMPLQYTCMAYATFVQDQKDPAYHGTVVTPQDTNLPLVRWKVSDTEYRVIFGDLHAETVDIQTLVDLEALLSQ